MCTTSPFSGLFWIKTGARNLQSNQRMHFEMGKKTITQSCYLHYKFSTVYLAYSPISTSLYSVLSTVMARVIPVISTNKSPHLYLMYNPSKNPSEITSYKPITIQYNPSHGPFMIHQSPIETTNYEIL